MTAILEPAPAKLSHAERLQAAAAITAKARHEIEQHDALAATVASMKALAAEGMLDDRGANTLLKDAEKVRLGEIVAPRRQRALDDAAAAEVKVALEVLGELADILEPLKAEAEAVADKLTSLLVDPLAADLRGDSVQGYDRDVGRTVIERFSRGTYRASVLAERIRTGMTTTWGSSHIPAAAREILDGFDHEVAAIKKGTAALRAALATLEKLSA